MGDIRESIKLSWLCAQVRHLKLITWPVLTRAYINSNLYFGNIFNYVCRDTNSQYLVKWYGEKWFENTRVRW
jgi:hypothetical protein